MADIIRLDVAAAPSSLPIVRMIVGGVAARLDLSLDDLEDVYLMMEELFCATMAPAEGPRLTVTIETAADGITVDAGPFFSPELRRRLSGEAPAGDVDLHALFGRVVQSLEVCAAGDDCFSVVFSKRRGAG